MPDHYTTQRPTVPALTVVGPPTAGATAPGTARLPGAAELRHVVGNGYDYAIDAQERTRSVSGTLTLNPDQHRSRSAQTAAGGADRLPGDDGGHYIARRFNGPTEAFNHFAQDATSIGVDTGRWRISGQRRRSEAKLSA